MGILKDVYERNNFYLRQYNKSIFLFFQLSVIIAGLLVLLWLISKRDGEKHYFLSDSIGYMTVMPGLDVNHLDIRKYKFRPDGKLDLYPRINLADLDQKLPPDFVLIDYWIKEVIEHLYTFDYINYRTVFQELRKYFTLDAYKQFIVAFEASRNMNYVKANQAVVYSKITGPVELKASGKFKQAKGAGDPVLGWKVEVPFSVYYENVSMKQPMVQKLIARLVITRVSTIDSPFFGLAIIQSQFLSV